MGILSFRERIRAKMTEPRGNNKFAVVNGHATTNGAVSKPAKESDIWALIELSKKIARDHEGVNSYAALVGEQKRLLADNEAREGENEELRRRVAEMDRDKQALLATFEGQCRLYGQNTAKVDEYWETIQGLEAQLEQARSAASRQQMELNAIKATKKTQDSELAQLKSKVSLLEPKLKACEAERKDYASQLGHGFLKLMDEKAKADLRSGLKTLQTKCHSLAMEFFSGSDAVENPAPSAHMMRSLQTTFKHLPLSTSQTRQADLMRCAAAQAVLAHALATHVFRPFYVPEDMDDAEGNMGRAVDDLVEFFEDDQSRQNIYRCQVLKYIRDEGGEPNSDDITTKATESVHRSLAPFIAATRLATFEQKVSKMFTAAVDLWSRVQLVRDLVSADMPGDWNDEEEGLEFDPEFGALTSPSSAAGHGKQVIAAVLFPRVLINDSVLQHGTVLWSDQAAVVDARADLNGGGGNGNGLSRSTTRRRLSMVQAT